LRFCPEIFPEGRRGGDVGKAMNTSVSLKRGWENNTTWL